ncbi:MAG: DUF2911 domain-containing protein [Cytophagales bacterium]|nr:DUF2911 domain-containing protein [Bernardetiaceae bacterium]MDW8210913.1 DUF2911 domain-containing protein [Cytophagales bacterium]
MKNWSILVLFALSALAKAQNQQPLSPPASVAEKVGQAVITIHYSQPSVRGRKIWGELVPYGKVWRTGANKATTFETTADITVEGKKLPKGKYALFTIPGEKEWVIIFNKQHDQWGAFNYKESEDALRVKVKPMPSDEHYEALTFDIHKDGIVSLLWEKLRVSFKIKPVS